MFSDAAGTVPIANGATVPSGQEIWMRSTGGSPSAVLQATATATVPSGNVYLYDGNSRRQRRPAAHPGPERNVDDDRPSHRPVPSPRLVDREKDDRRPRCRIAGAGRHPREPAPTGRTDPTSKSPRAPPQAHIDHLPRRPGRSDMYRHRDLHRQRGRGQAWRSPGAGGRSRSPRARARRSTSPIPITTSPLQCRACALPAHHQDHRRPARRSPGTSRHRRDLQRHPHGRLRDRLADPGGQRVARRRRHSRRLGMHRHRDRRWCHRRGCGDRVGQWPAGDHTGGSRWSR